MSRWIQSAADNLISKDSIDNNYTPYTETPFEYNRPPRIPGCVLDYFIAISLAEEDGGENAHREMKRMLEDPDKFFSPI
jgi:hypothetical protein